MAVLTAFITFLQNHVADSPFFAKRAAEEIEALESASATPMLGLRLRLMGLRLASEESDFNLAAQQAVQTFFEKRFPKKAAEAERSRWLRGLFGVLLTENLAETIVWFCESDAFRAVPRPQLATGLARAEVAAGKNESALEPFLKSVLKQAPDDVELLLAMGTLRLIQQQGPDAVKLYRQVLKIEPENLRALNDLAFALSEQDAKSPEPLQVIEEAVRIAGRKPNLLDTWGMVLLRRGESKAALELCEESVQLSAPDPVNYLHLASAYFHAGKKESARASFALAQSMQLSGSPLTPGEHAALKELTDAFGQIE